MYFNIVASGSKGNATLIVENNTLILIDVGITQKRLIEGLQEINLQISDISAVFITHEHADHIRGIKFFSPKKIYGTKGSISSSLNNIIDLYRPVKIKDLEITAFPIHHDAKNPCGYLIKSRNETLVYATDIGCFEITKELEIIKNPTYLILESNHDIGMLEKTNRPLELKRRILSDFGHLCNENSAFACLDIIGDNTKEIVLAHLSEEANSPSLALDAYKKIFAFKGIDVARYKVRCANQWQSLRGGNCYED